MLTDEMVKAYRAGVTKQEKAQYEHWLGVERIINPRETRHTVCVSLFWKNTHAEDAPLPKPTKWLLKNPGAAGIHFRVEPWDHYVKPLLEAAKLVAKERKDASFRVYLASDMEFLVADLVKVGCEVRLMNSPSISHNPGALWRFLALEDKSTMVTFTDSDRAPDILADLDRTDTMARSGLGMWRVPWLPDEPLLARGADKQSVTYRPILGCQFGSVSPLPARLLMEALHWNTTKGLIETICHPAGCGPREIYGTRWPDYGFDEWFLQAAVYPRISKKGVLSFIPAGGMSKFLPLDVEYVTWANPRSEVVNFGSIAGACCGPDPKTAALKPSTVETIPVRDNTLIIVPVLPQSLQYLHQHWQHWNFPADQEVLFCLAWVSEADLGKAPQPWRQHTAQIPMDQASFQNPDLLTPILLEQGMKLGNHQNFILLSGRANPLPGAELFAKPAWAKSDCVGYGRAWRRVHAKEVAEGFAKPLAGRPNQPKHRQLPLQQYLQFGPHFGMIGRVQASGWLRKIKSVSPTESSLPGQLTWSLEQSKARVSTTTPSKLQWRFA